MLGRFLLGENLIYLRGNRSSIVGHYTTLVTGLTPVHYDALPKKLQNVPRNET